ncbi:MAG TPA: phosphatidate cytidylyltransferase [Planctomycetota bacterium]|nr:phosphatidate cytidylyltransferase [Planctomycetota bacterium]
MSGARERWVLGALLVAAIAGAIAVDARFRGLPTCVLVGGLAILCAVETAAMFGSAGVDAFSKASLGAAMGVVLARVVPHVERAIFPSDGLPAISRLTSSELAVLGFLVFGALCVLRGRIEGAAQTLGAGALVVGVPAGLLHIVDIRFAGDGLWLVVFLVLTSKIGDIAAYVFGSQYGRAKLAPKVSPKKSWVGAAASLVAATGAGALLAVFNLVSLSVGDAVFGAIVVNVASQFGDLMESLLKRSAGVKDSGRWLPEFGGAFDLVDSLVVAAPAFYGYLRLGPFAV